MRVRIVRLGMALCVAGCFFPCVCQTVSEFELYSGFFQKVAKPATLNGQPATLNGQPTGKPIPTVQETTGLTDGEMRLAAGIAIDCQTSIDSLYQRNRHVVFDALMESIETGKDTSGDAQQRLKDIQSQRERILSDHVNQLKAALGEARFQELAAHLHTEVASRPQAARR